jgi:hypothetical protein
VDGVGVGEHQQAIALGEACQQAFRDQGVRQEDAAPDLAELLVGDAQAEHAAELFHEIARLDQAGFEAVHQIGGGDAFRNLGGGIIAEFFHGAVAAGEIEGDQDLAQIEDDGFDHVAMAVQRETPAGVDTDFLAGLAGCFSSASRIGFRTSSLILPL